MVGLCFVLSGGAAGSPSPPLHRNLHSSPCSSFALIVACQEASGDQLTSCTQKHSCPILPMLRFLCLVMAGLWLACTSHYSILLSQGAHTAKLWPWRWRAEEEEIASGQASLRWVRAGAWELKWGRSRATALPMMVLMPQQGWEHAEPFAGVHCRGTLLTLHRNGDIQDQAGQGSEQSGLAVGVLVHWGGVGLDDSLESLQAKMILWFSKLNKSCSFNLLRMEVL